MRLFLSLSSSPSHGSYQNFDLMLGAVITQTPEQHEEQSQKAEVTFTYTATLTLREGPASSTQRQFISDCCFWAEAERP